MSATITPAEYLALDREADHKSEYFDGELFAMAGASPEHVLIVSNIVAELQSALRDKPCVIFSTDLRLRISSTGHYAYPDVAVACGELEFADDHRDTLVNPVVIFEVLSESTQDYDRGSKFAHYRTIKSLMHYVLVAQDKPHVEYFTRESVEDPWVLWETDRQEDSIPLGVIDCNLTVGSLYRKLELIKRARAEG